MDNLANLSKHGVIPDVIDTQPAKSIAIKYAADVEVLQGNELTPTQVKDEPKISFEADPNKLYTLIKVDPDAPSRKDPKFREILHMLVANIPGNQLDKGDVLAAYVGSGAPKDTGLHRYIYLLYEQPQGKLQSSMKIPNNSRHGRVSFNTRNFVSEHKLHGPVAANFYQAQYDDYVPVLHAQLSQVQ